MLTICIPLLVLVAGCGGSDNSFGRGEARVTLALGSAVSPTAVSLTDSGSANLPDDITRATVSVTSEDGELTPIHAELPLDGSPVTLTVAAGPRRVFTISAYEGDALRMQGTTTLDYLQANTETTVTVTLSDLATLTLSPVSAAVEVATQQQFNTSITAHQDGSVSWSVAGVDGGNSTVGTIDGNGLYTAPAVVPIPADVTIRATSNADPTLHAEAVVTVTPSPGCLGGSVIVDSTADQVDLNPGDGLCDDGSGRCTLRAAIQEANACVGPDVIELAAGTYALTLAGASENATLTGDLDITDELTINGAGAATTIIDASAPFDDRIFHVLNNVSTTFDGLTLQGVTLDWNVGGGGIETGGNLLVANAVISDNTGGYGTAINAWNQNAVITVSNTTIANNAATGAYGAIRVEGTLDLDQSTLTGNTLPSAYGHYGAAIYGGPGSTINISNHTVIDNNSAGYAEIVRGAENSTINISDSTISNTQAGRAVTGWSDSTINITRSRIINNLEGGVSSTGAYQYGGGSVLNIVDSTIDGNVGTGVGSYSFNGAGIYTDGTFTITGSTISNNRIMSSLSGGGGGAGLFMAGTGTIVNSTFSGNINSGTNSSGGAISSWDGNSRLSLQNTTFHANQSTWVGWHIAFAGSIDFVNTIFSSGNCDLSNAAVTSNGYNIDSGNSCGLTAATDLVSTDPLLAPLADNGGSTLTHALQAGSPAIDAGNDTVCPATDQRGVTRPQGLQCDVGAYEAQ